MKMIKRRATLVLTMLMAAAIFTSCASSGSPAQAPAPEPQAQATETPKPASEQPAPVSEQPAPVSEEPVAQAPTAITLFNNKVEIDGALKNYAKVYEEKTGVKVDIRTAGGDTDYNTALVSQIQGGEEPEIFVFEGPSSYEKFQDRFIDLSDQPWVKDTDVAFTYTDGKVYGFPVAIEGYGLAYNKDILDKAGVDPSTLTNFAAVKSAFETIDAQKGDLGLDCVISMGSSQDMWWVVTLHNMNVYLTGGCDYNDTSVADDFMNGKLDEARFKSYTDYVDFLFKYSDKRTLSTGTYDDQLNGFINQKAAFIHQGNWIEPNLADAGVAFNMGYAPHPFLETDTDGIFAAAPSWYGINGLAPGVDAAKQFLIDMVNTPEGHDYIVNKAGMIPAFKTISLKPAGQLSQSVMGWANAGKIYSWQQYRYPDGFAQNKLAPVYQLFAAGTIDAAQFNSQLTDVISKIND